MFHLKICFLQNSNKETVTGTDTNFLTHIVILATPKKVANNTTNNFLE